MNGMIREDLIERLKRLDEEASLRFGTVAVSMWSLWEAVP